MEDTYSVMRSIPYTLFLLLSVVGTEVRRITFCFYLSWYPMTPRETIGSFLFGLNHNISVSSLENRLLVFFLKSVRFLFLFFISDPVTNVFVSTLSRTLLGPWLFYTSYWSVILHFPPFSTRAPPFVSSGEPLKTPSRIPPTSVSLFLLSKIFVPWPYRSKLKIFW